MRFRDLLQTHTISIDTFRIVLVSVLCLSIATPVPGFRIFEHHGTHNLKTLIKKVHDQHWTIYYSYGDNCPPEERNNDAALTASVTEALQMWLAPLREYTDRPIVADFRYKRVAFEIADWNDVSDFNVIFYCDIAGSGAATRLTHSPTMYQHTTTNVEQAGFMSAHLHEMGHIFGLADTYTTFPLVKDKRGFEKVRSKGGLDSTIGTQPESNMADSSWHRNGRPVLGKDDKNGIVYLYKVVYEDLSIRDCFFIDYELEQEPLGCVPKHPLIFEVKHGIEVRVLRMLEQDKNLDINAQDTDGMTALHYAVLYEYDRLFKVLLGHIDINVNAQDKNGRTALHYAVSHELDAVVEKLLSHKDILPYLRDTQGRSALQIARENELDDMITLLLAHPLTLSVNAKGKLATTWGHLKKQY